MSLVDKYFPVLDKGFVALKDYMGSDQDIEQAARVSYQSGTRKVSDTRGLIRYLVRHRHTSPLEQAELKFHVKVPMYIWRQWVRHRTAQICELSGRYSVMENEQHETPPNEWRLQSKNNKQGSDGYVDNDTGEMLTDDEKYVNSITNDVYEHRLSNGIAREQARKDLPLSTYTEAFWKIDLHNLLHFLNLRCDSHAQKEIRDYANIIASIVKELFPITFEAWEDYVFYAETFSKQEIKLLISILGDYDLDSCNKTLNLDLSNRELSEFDDKIKKLTHRSI